MILKYMGLVVIGMEEDSSYANSNINNNTSHIKNAHKRHPDPPQLDPNVYFQCQALLVKNSGHK